MSVESRALAFHHFGPDDPLDSLGESRAIRYIRRYLDDLACRSVVEEPVYFDHDYLAEFAAFYCKSTRGYSNSCRRLHFFADDIDRGVLERAAGEDETEIGRLQRAYLGFAVVRPFKPALLGRTVLVWYSQNPSDGGTRVTTPSRDYKVHLAGIKLIVHGLAWQPQDHAVGACATVALWSMFHSSAFDDHHAIPTTAAITEAAHTTASLGSRMYPSGGLTTYQLLEAIKAQSLAPNVIEGDRRVGSKSAFSRARFLATCAAFIRSGYPVLAMGIQFDRSTEKRCGRHAICITGFRDPQLRALRDGSDSIQFDDSDVTIVYVHDDGLGPGVRCRVTLASSGDVRLVPEAPPSRQQSMFPDPSRDYPLFQPSSLVVAVHSDLTITSDSLHQLGLTIATYVRDALADSVDGGGDTNFTVSLQTRFIALRQYMSQELREYIGPGDQLARVRMALTERAPAMSLHLGLVRLSINRKPLMDVLFDTTDNERYLRAFANVQYDEICEKVVPEVQLFIGRDLGVGIDAYS